MGFIIPVQAVIGVLLALSILVQHRASGLSASMGGTGTVQVQRRGAERVLYRFTVILSIIFFGLTILQWYV
jgi:protein translocase SecG subunit